MNGIVKITAQLLADDGGHLNGIAVQIPAHISRYTDANGMTPALGGRPGFQIPAIQTVLPDMPASASWPAGVYTDAPQDCWPPCRLYWTPDKARQGADYLRTAFIPTIRMLAGQPDLPYPQARLYAELTAQARNRQPARRRPIAHRRRITMMLRRNPNPDNPAPAPLQPDAPLTAAELAQLAHTAIDDIGAVGYQPQKAAAAAHIALDQAIAAAGIDASDAAIAAALGAATQAAYQAGARLDDARRTMLRDMAAQCARDSSVRNAPTPADAIAIAAGLGVAAGQRIALNWDAQDGGYMDAFGLHPDARARSWEGRYDGAAD